MQTLLYISTFFFFSFWSVLGFVASNFSTTRDFGTVTFIGLGVFAGTVLVFLLARRYVNAQSVPRLAAVVSVGAGSFFTVKLVHEAITWSGLSLSVMFTWLALTAVLVIATWFLITTRERFLALVAFGGAAFATPLLSLALAGNEPAGSQIASDKKIVFDGDPVRRPNVYYLLVDGYGRSDMLKKYTGFDNGQFTTFLDKKGFQLPEKAHANFFVTALSIPALLEMRPWFPKTKRPEGYNADMVFFEHFQSGDNAVYRNFRHLGYKIFTAAKNSMCFEKAVDACIYSNDHISDATRDFLYNTPIMPVLYRLVPDMHDQLNSEAIPVLGGEMTSYLDNYRKINTTPFFIFSHLAEVHDNTYYADCRRREMSLQDELAKVDLVHRMTRQTTAYVDGLKCVNSKLEKFVDHTLRVDPDAIIIITADHGTAFSATGDEKWPTNETVYERLSIMSAWRMPDSCKEYLPASIDVANNFRVVFSCIYGNKLPLLPDKVYGGFDFPFIKEYRYEDPS